MDEKQKFTDGAGFAQSHPDSQRQGPGSSSDVAQVQLGFSRAQGDTIKSSLVPGDRSLSEEESWTRAGNCQSKGLSAVKTQAGESPAFPGT